MEPERISELESAAFANFANAISASGTVTPATVVVSTVMSVTTAITVPANVKLRFTGGGMLAVGSGGVVTINGSIMAAPTQRLFALTGTGAVYTSTATVPEVWVEWFGAKADATGVQGVGTDSTAAIQAAIQAPTAPNTITAPNGGGVVRFTGGAYRITSTLQVWNLDTSRYRNNIQLIGAWPDSYTGPGTLIFWDSATATAPMLDLWTMNSRLEGLALSACAGRTALVGVDIDDAWVATSHTTGTHFICTQNELDHVGFIQTFAGTGIMTYGVRISNTATSNVEFMSFNHCNFYNIPTVATGIAAGIYIPATTYQSKRHKLRSCNLIGTWDHTKTGVCYGIYSQTGDYVARDCNVTALSTAYYQANVSDGLQIYDGSGEGCRQLLYALRAGNMGPVVISGGRYATDQVLSAPANGNEFIYCNLGGGGLVMLGVKFDAGPNAFFSIQVNGGGGTECMMTAMGCLFPNSTPLTPNSANYRANLLSCAYTASDGNYPMDDQFLGSSPSGSLSFATPMSVQAPQRLPFWAQAVSAGAALLGPRVVLTPTGGTLVNDYLRWAISFVTPLGETKIGPPTATLLTNNTTSQGVLTQIPAGPAGVTTVNIYRWDNTSNTYGKVGSVANGTTTFTDTGFPKGAAPPASDTSGLTTLQDGMLETDGLTATTVGAAGAASALPANPVGYRLITVGGTRYKVPYYNV